MSNLTSLLSRFFRPGRSNPVDPVSPSSPVNPSAGFAPPAYPAAPLAPAAPQSTSLRKGTLAALIGIPAAAMLLSVIPEDESGREVAVSVAPDGTATVKHVRGRQYLDTYLDIVGIPTACDGLTDRQKIRLGVSFTEAQCARMLEEALIVHAKGMLDCSPGFDPKAHPYQTVALVSFTYNLGVGAYCKSSIRRALVAGDLRYACDRLLPFNKARVKGVLQPVRGLTNRRNREREYCLTNIEPGHGPENLKQRLARFK